MHLHRRGFLGAALGSLSIGAASRPGHALQRGARAAAPSEFGGRHLVIVQLLGGNEDLQMLVPFEDDRYHRARPDLAHPRKQVRRLDELNGLHPGMRRLGKRFDRGEVAFVRNVGYPEPNLSHFRSQDIWDLADTSPGGREAGWLGRWATEQRAPREDGVPTLLSVAGPRMPLSFYGAETQALYLATPDAPRLRFAGGGSTRAEAELRARTAAALHGLAPEDDPFRTSLELARRSSKALERAERVDTRGSYPGNELAQSLAFVARTLAAGVGSEVTHVVHDGYDTHAAQSKVQGRLLRELDASLDAFQADLERQGIADRVLVCVVSEFGRRLAQGGRGDAAGTDHGVAGSVILFGRGVQGGIHGGQPRLGELDGNGNVPWSVDFRQVYGTLLGGWLGSDTESVLGAGFEQLEVLA